MSYTKQMLDTYQRTFNIDATVLAVAINALGDCAQACAVDVTADLSEHDLGEMVKCIRLCLDCVDVCTAAVGITSRLAQSDDTVIKPLLEASVASCRSCGDECERHAQMHEHCQVCAEACRRCENACRELIDAIK